MIISHKYKFIFIKTKKTAGTSIEIYLSQLCGKQDVITPDKKYPDKLILQNHKEIYNPIPEILEKKGRNVAGVLKRYFRNSKYFYKYYNHISAAEVRNRLPAEIWNNYYKFCVERNPWDKTLSHYYMLKDEKGGKLTLEEYFNKGKFCKNIDKYTNQLGEVIVDKVVRYEYLNEELGKIFEYLGIPFKGKLDFSGRTEHRKDKRSYVRVFSTDQKNIIENIFADEIYLHGYKFKA